MELLPDDDPGAYRCHLIKLCGILSRHIRTTVRAVFLIDGAAEFGAPGCIVNTIFTSDKGHPIFYVAAVAISAKRDVS